MTARATTRDGVKVILEHWSPSSRSLEEVINWISCFSYRTIQNTKFPDIAVHITLDKDEESKITPGQVGDSHESLTFHPLESGGVKHDQSKLPLDLLDPAALEGLAAVLQFGANKYAAHNWRSGFKWTRLIAAMLRHTFAIMRGELNDPESGLPHIDHVGCCWMFLSNMMKTRPDLNDIYKENQVNKS